MNCLENYKNIIDRIYGNGTATFDTQHNNRNNIIGALADQNGNFAKFKRNFIARLNRLYDLYKGHQSFSQLKVQINEIADSKNWEGAFAELTAYDFLRQFGSISLNVTLPAQDSFATELNKHETNLDGKFDDFNVHFDVKSLKDNNTEVLRNITTPIEHKYQNHIAAEYPINASYETIVKNFRKLKKELDTELSSGRPSIIYSKIVPNLCYKILWGSGIMSTFSSYEPYKHAENLHHIIFNYINKFLKADPTIIVFVLSPWYNKSINSFINNNEIFYRAFARRCFCQYRHSTEPFSSINRKFNGNQSIYEVSRKLSGIFFLEDKTISSTDPDDLNVHGYFFTNPNADNPMTNFVKYVQYNHQYIKSYDNFMYDNY